jgi:ABC-type nitrate/sulfonate/bicarbonate transport system permease component
VKSRILSVVLPLSVLLAIGLVWEAAVRGFEIPSYILPGPAKILVVMWHRLDLLVFHGLITLLEIGLGFLAALVLGVGLAVAIHASRTVERSLMPLVIASQTIPVFAIAPLLILWFGYGIGSKVVMTLIIVFFPIVINTVQGLRAADPDTVALLRILEASPLQIFFKVRVPQALPHVFSGLKIGVAVSVIGAVIGEWVGAQRGLGYLMIHANAQLQVELVFASIGFLSLVGVGLYGLVSGLERVLMPWRR